MAEPLRLLIDRTDTPIGELVIVADRQGRLRAVHQHSWGIVAEPSSHRSPNASREGGLQAGTYNECVDISGPLATIAARNSCDHRPTPRRGWLKFLHAPCLTGTRTVSAGTMAPTAGTRAWGRLYLGSRSPVGACLKGLPDSGRWAGRRSTVVAAT